MNFVNVCPSSNNQISPVVTALSLVDVLSAKRNQLVEELDRSIHEVDEIANEFHCRKSTPPVEIQKKEVLEIGGGFDRVLDATCDLADGSNIPYRSSSEWRRRLEMHSSSNYIFPESARQRHINLLRERERIAASYEHAVSQLRTELKLDDAISEMLKVEEALSIVEDQLSTVTQVMEKY